MSKKALLKAFAPLGVAVLLLSGCTSGSDSGSTGSVGGQGNETLRVNWGGFPDNWAPGSPALAGYLRAPYETLVLRTREGEILPNLATEWQFGEGSTSLTMKLRDDVTFHDDTKFNAQAVVANVDYVSNVAGGQFGGPLKAGVKSVDVVDDYTVKFNFTRPYGTFLDLLSQRNLLIGSPAAIIDGSIKATPVGTGPWTYDQSKSIDGTKMFFGKFDKYWGDKPAFPNIEMYGVDDDTASAAAVLAGDMDITTVKPEALPRFDGAANVEHFDYPAIRNNITFFDRGPGGIFGDVKVRQALCLAMDAKVVADLGHGDAHNQHFLEGEPGYNPDIQGWSGDLEKAKKLWSEAGSPTITAALLAAPFNKQEVIVRAEQMNKLPGVKITVQDVAAPQFISTWSSGQYPLGLGNHTQLSPADWYNAWFSETANGNPSKTASPELKKLAGEARAAGGAPEAADKWKAVMKQISDEALTCSHYVGPETIAYNKDTVTEVKPAIQSWEPALVDYRSLRPTN